VGFVRDYRNQVALDEFLLPLTILPFYGKRLVERYGKIRAFLESNQIDGEAACVSGLKGRDIPAQGNALGTGCKDS